MLFRSYVLFVLLLTVATVFAPVTVLPIIPAVAPIFGPFTTGILSIVGWTIGASIAFVIARYVGRPFIERFLSVEKIDRVIRRLSPDTQFYMVILLRLTIPVDVASYAIGLTSTISFWKYTIATVIGVSWFSFAFAYLGNAFFERNTLLLEIVGVLSLIIFIGGWYILTYHKDK